MNRAGFIRSMLMIAATPSIIGEIKFEPIAKIIYPYQKKLAFYFIITPEMREDIPGFKNLLEDKKSFIYEKAKQAGVNMDKPFNVNVGYNNEDFIENTISVIVSQYI